MKIIMYSVGFLLPSLYFPRSLDKKFKKRKRNT